MQGSAPNILLVDDDDGFRCATTMVLEKAGFAVAAERDYVGALKVLQSERPIDLLLTDVAMPTLHGFALARMARVRRPVMKIIYITGFDVPASEALGPVLRKPVSDEALIDAIRNTLASPP